LRARPQNSQNSLAVTVRSVVAPLSVDTLSGSAAIVELPALTAPGGTLVFHSLRHTYCTLVIESGAKLTEAQRLLRHQGPTLTANIYSHARRDRLQSVAEAVGSKVIYGENQAHSKHRLIAGAEGIDISALARRGLDVAANGGGLERQVEL